MKIIDRFKYYFAKKKLRKLTCNVKRQAVVCNFKDIKSLGIIFNATQINDFHFVKAKIKELQNQIPIVKALGFVEKKHLDDFHIQPLDFSFFCLSDLNFSLQPNENSVENFENQEFDVLIDLCKKSCISVKIVVANSKALFKIGYQTNFYPEIYDLTIMTPTPEENEDQTEYSEIKILYDAIIHYLNIIKPFEYEN
ncbi:MAG: hypothetical protein WHW07_08850 [Bacteroidales bacterium]|jgi:hypothetical protein|nr:hypothetical protein [Bacteroidales bacterium]HOL96993.1 hypothetical protein [Bacteroidales bacterium]HOM36290.1 hypothetical protein [Bacteroidales bacterium]HPD23786.1 hypothetical protein [Bacteroidales bacterium]HRS98678.1 hypothetical protein [Bacteroidales bacterium]